MAAISNQQHPVQGFFRGLSELDWFNTVLDFLFKFTAYGSEFLLAVGVILSTANHFQHGALFSTMMPLAHGKTLLADTPIFQVWTWTQAIGFEASAGVVLTRAIKANQENDKLKRTILLSLMAGLAFVGTVMLVMALVEASAGIHESNMPLWYGIVMAILRGVVSVAYVTIGRVKNLRFSGNEIVQPLEVPNLLARIERMETSNNQQIQQVIENLQAVQSSLPTLVQSQSHVIIAEVQALVQSQLKMAVQSMVFELPELVSGQVQTLISEQANGQVQSLLSELPMLVQSSVSEQVREVVQALEHDGSTSALQELSERLHEVSMSVSEMRTTITEVRTVTQRKAVKEPIKLVHSVPKVVESEQANGQESEPVEQRVKRYILAQRGQGNEPSLSDIVNKCDCAKGSAIRYRRELGGPDEISAVKDQEAIS